jgi:Uma2 family endonuclease
VIFNEHNAVIPDLVYVSRSRAPGIIANNRFVAAPELVIEIVSPGRENEDRDRVAKRQVYGRFGVAEYWIVDPQQQTVEIYRLAKRSLRLVKRLGVADELGSPLLPGYSCQLRTIFAAPLI